MRPLHLTPVLLLVAMGCAGQSHWQVEPAPVEHPGRTFSARAGVLTGDEVRAANQPHARAALERLRPWLHGNRSSRGDIPPVVFVDGVRVYHLVELEGISSAVIHEIRFLSATEANFRFGPQSSGSAIAITTRRARGAREAGADLEPPTSPHNR
jgi:hypothetical protein